MSTMEAFTPYPHRDVIVLTKHPGTGKQMLFNIITGEVVELPECVGSYTLVLDGETGMAFLVDDAWNPAWAQSFLNFEVKRLGESGQLWVFGPNRVGWELPDFNTAAEERSVVLHGVGFSPVCIDIFKFERPHLYSEIWWSLPSLFSSLGVETWASDWYHEGWQRWQRALQAVGVPPTPHLRRGLDTRGTPERLRRDAVESASRCLRVYSISTIALVILLTRWTAAPIRASNTTPAADDRRLAWTTVAKTLFQCALDGCELELGVTRPIDCQVPHAGECFKIRLEVVSGQVSVLPLLGCPYLERFPFMDKLRAESVVGVLDLLQLADGAGRMALPFFRMFAHVVAGSVERWALRPTSGCPDGREAAAEPQPSGGAGAHGSSRASVRRKRQLEAYSERKDASQEQANIMKYYMCAREHFSGKQNLCMAVDASRIGKRKTFVGAIGDVGGLVGVAPPQALLGAGIVAERIPVGVIVLCGGGFGRCILTRSGSSVEAESLRVPPCGGVAGHGTWKA